jgi:hypothetical protein
MRAARWSIGDMMYVHTPFPNKVFALDLANDGKICLEVRAEAGSVGHPGDVLRHRQPRPGLRQRQDLPASGRHHRRGARRQDRQVLWSVANGDPGKGETNTATVLPVKDKVYRRYLRR